MTLPPSSDPLDAVRDLQLKELKENVADLRRELVQSISTLGGQMTSLQTQMVAGQQSLGEHFQPRREAAVVQDATKEMIAANQRGMNELIQLNVKALADMIATNTKRIERLEQAGWGALILILGTLGTALFSLFREGALPH